MEKPFTPSKLHTEVWYIPIGIGIINNFWLILHTCLNSLMRVRVLNFRSDKTRTTKCGLCRDKVTTTNQIRFAVGFYCLLLNYKCVRLRRSFDKYFGYPDCPIFIAVIQNFRILL